MATHVSYRDGGKTSEEGFYRPFRKLLSTVGVMGSGDLAVSQRGAGANKSVDIAAGDAFFSYGNYAYYAWNTATLNDSSTVITDNTSGNPRIDAVVAYIDLTVISSASSNNPDALKFAVVAGTPAGSPTAPSDGTIQSAIGASNPFLRLANVAVANGFSSIVNANITDTRSFSTVLAKATGSDITTGTDDAKYATAKALADAGVNTRLASKVISATRDMTAANGSVAYTGVGFRPSTIISFGGVDGGGRIYIGFCDSTMAGKQMESYAADTWQTSLNNLCNIQTSASNGQIGVVTSFDADGFTLSWTKGGSPTGTANLNFLCFR